MEKAYEDTSPASREGSVDGTVVGMNRRRSISIGYKSEGVVP
jgi:hypothetical protein